MYINLITGFGLIAFGIMGLIWYFRDGYKLFSNPERFTLSDEDAKKMADSIYTLKFKSNEAR